MRARSAPEPGCAATLPAPAIGTKSPRERPVLARETCPSDRSRRGARGEGLTRPVSAVRVSSKVLRFVEVKPGQAALAPGVLEFDGEGERRRIEGSLRGAVNRAEQRALWTGRVDADDACRWRFTKQPQHRLRDGDDAEHVGLDTARRSSRDAACKMPCFPASEVPALFTRTSRRPNSLRMRFAAAAIEACFVTSSWTARASAPMLFAAVSACSILRDPTSTVRPCVARSLAIWRPIPLLAAVTRAIGLTRMVISSFCIDV